MPNKHIMKYLPLESTVFPGKRGFTEEEEDCDAR
jgi:hypothetical protein